MAERLKGKTALITGGTSGIGLATARLFQREGATVLVTGQNSVESARTELGEAVHVLQSDAGDPEAIAALLAQAKTRLGELDIVFLNAGVGRFGPMSVFDLAQLDELYRTNFRGPWLTLKLALPILRKGASVIVTTSVANQTGMAGSSGYAASKAALRAMVRAAASELAESGIRVNAVSPGPVETPIYAKLGLPPEARDVMKASLTSQMPMKRFGAPEEIAAVVLFLATSEASFMTGEEIVVDGGMTRV
jgi:NAD(P)-dependent dehydrogenase (short-subunit alcohol dehydrogenase family)